MTPHGWDLEAGWQSLLAGRSAVAAIRRFDASSFPSRIAAEAPPPPAEVAAAITAELDPAGELDDAAHMGWWAARQALAGAGLTGSGRGGAAESCGLVFTAGGYGSDHAANLAGLQEALGPDGQLHEATYLAVGSAAKSGRTLERRIPSSSSARLASALGLTGPQLALDTACASGAEAVATAGRWIRSGFAERVVAVAGDSHLSPFGLTGFCLLGALSQRNDEPQRASRPFDRDRDGFVLGEGGAALVLEEMAAARRRGARILGELRGWGSACDAHRITDPHPEAHGARRALRRALSSAGLEPGAIGYVNAHGTSTPANDRTESLALHAVFAGSPPPTSSTKSMLGHLVTAAGAVEAIVTLLALRDQVLPPTINLDALDPECRLDVVPNASREARFEHAISSSFGFGGSCTCLALARLEAA